MRELSLEVAGTRMYAQVYEPAGKPRNGVLLLHGFNSCLLEFGRLPADLAEAGFLVCAIDFRGHGLSGGERGLINLQRASADIDVGLDYLQEQLSKKAKLAIIGHSLGGALTLGHAARSKRAHCLVVAHPVDRLFDELGPIGKAGYHAMGRLGKMRMRRGRPAGYINRPPRYDHLFVSNKAAKAASKQSFLDPKVNVANYTFAVTMQASDWASHTNVPVLGIQSKHDKTVQPSHTDDVLNAVAGPTERLRHDGGHSCFRDVDAGKISTGIVTFLRHHLEK